MLFRNDDMNDPAGKRPPVRTVPLLPLRDIIVFPHMVVPLFVGREKSIAALEEAMSHDKDILLAAQKEYYLNEQMQAIQKELGERDEFKSELQELEEKIKNKKMSKEAITKAKKELRKLKMMSPMSAEATVVRNYIDW